MNRPLNLFNARLKTVRVFCALFAVFFFSQSASAWDVGVSMDRLDDYFYVDFFSGTHTWTTLSEGLSADSGMGTIPNNLVSQGWDGSTWPSAMMSDMELGSGGLSAESYIEHEDEFDEFFDYAESFVFGDIPAGEAYGASWFYDFSLTLEAFATANVFLDSDGAYGYLESQPGDDGNAFASVRLYSVDAGLNDPGGINDPFDIDSLFLSAPPSSVVNDSQLGLSHTFENLGSTPVTYNLRLLGRASVFENVLEPTSLVLLSLSGLGMLLCRRSKSR